MGTALGNEFSDRNWELVFSHKSPVGASLVSRTVYDTDRIGEIDRI